MSFHRLFPYCILLAITFAPSASAALARLGQNVTFTVAASGTAPFTYQWYKGTKVIPGATTPKLRLSALKLTDAGSYYVKVSNAAGSATSSFVKLDVLTALLTPPTPTPTPTRKPTPTPTRKPTPSPTKVPVITVPAPKPSPVPTQKPVATPTAKPTAMPTQKPTAAPVTGPSPTPKPVATAKPTPTPTRKPSPTATPRPTATPTKKPTPTPTPRPTATPTKKPTPTPTKKPTPTPSPTPVLSSYEKNSGLGVPSLVAPTAHTLSVASVPGRLERISVQSMAGRTDGALTVGTAVVGTTSSPFLTRVAGPALVSLGTRNAMRDPRMSLYSGKLLVTTNNNWTDGGMTSSFTSLFTIVGAFPYPPTNARDAAMQTLQRGAYRTVVEPQGSTGGGLVLLENFDVFRSPNTKLIHVAALVWAGTGTESASGGFTLQTTKPQKVLLRAIGPSLGQHQVSLVCADPILELFRTEGSRSIAVASNDNWSDASALKAAFKPVGAFEPAPGSRDAALLVTLNAGTYTFAVKPVNGAPGRCLVEVYLVP